MKVGDYVRTKYGNIGKIIEQNDYNVVINSNNNMEFFISKKDIIKSNPNIIDVIEVGDYINGYRVLNDLDFNDNSKMLSLEKIYDSKITKEDIKSIVTKEQFESMEYKVGE